MKPIRYISLLLALGLIQSCAPVNEPHGGVTTAPYSSNDYMQLDNEQKYAITSKLLATLYKGEPAAQFFDLGKGLSSPVLKQDIDHLAAIRTQLNTPVDDLGGRITATFDKHFSSDISNTRAIPMALLYEIPLSKEYYNRWMAYVLTNTILFSPALELDSVDPADVETVYNNLVAWLDQGMTMSEIVYQHMISEENWRRFRSPEDNTREMMEIYLMRFRDDEVPLASIACKNWFLTDASDDFQLRKTANVNSQPQTLLERNDIASCEDFYLALSQHSQLKPAISRRIVDLLFAEYPVSKRASLALSISRKNPVYFQDIFNSILFSKDYLFNMQRTKGYEEALYGTGKRIYWYDRAGIYGTITNTNLVNMSQKTMTLKLGRQNETPKDSLSFAYYHKAIRDGLMLFRRSGTTTGHGGWDPTPLINSAEVASLSNDDFIHYLMLATVGRKAYDYEITALTPLMTSYSANRANQTYIVMDYASRLSEFYSMKAIR